MCDRQLELYRLEMLSLTKRFEIAVTALEFYGRSDNWKLGHGGEYESRIELDNCGNVARRTLTELRGEKADD